MSASSPARGSRSSILSRRLAIGVVALVILLVIARQVFSPTNQGLDGSWRSGDPVQTGMNPPRALVFHGDTVVLSVFSGAVTNAQARTYDTPPLHYTRDATTMTFAMTPIALTYTYHYDGTVLTLSSGAITFTYHRA